MTDFGLSLTSHGVATGDSQPEETHDLTRLVDADKRGLSVWVGNQVRARIRDQARSSTG